MLQYHVLSKGSLTQLLVENRSKNRNFGSLIAAKNIKKKKKRKKGKNAKYAPAFETRDCYSGQLFQKR